MKRRANHSNRAFTLLELVVILTILCVLVAVLIPACVKMVAKQKRIACVGRQKNIGLGYRIFATDNRDLFPWQLATNAPTPKTFDEAITHYLAISNALSTPKILICPADNRRPAPDWARLSRSNISYFISLVDSAETYPQSILAGDRNITTNGVRIGPGIVRLSTLTTNAAWDGTIHRFQGNVTMGDGSIQQLSATRLREQVMNTGLAEMRLAVP